MVFNIEANSPPKTWAFITHDVSVKLIPKKVKNKNPTNFKVEFRFLSESKTNLRTGIKEMKIKYGNEFGGQDTKNKVMAIHKCKISFTNLIFSNSIAINCFNLLQI